MTIDDLHVPGTVLAIADGRETGRIGGFLHLAPSPAGGGWSLSTMRRRPDAPNGLTEFLIVETVAWAKATGASELSLNFCAFTDFISPERATSVPTRLVRRVLLLADNVFQLERLYVFNRKFFPEWRRRYICVERFSGPARGRARVPPRRVAARAAGPVDAPPRGTPPRRSLTSVRIAANLSAMSTTRSIGRLSEIAQVMVRHGFGYFFEAHRLSDLLPGRSAEDRIAHRGRRRTAPRPPAASICGRCSTSSGRPS